MQFSMVPILFFIEAALIYIAAKKTLDAGLINPQQRRLVNSLLVALGIWGIISSYLSINGFYHAETFKNSLPGLWITQIPVLIVVIPWMLSKPLRQATDSIIDNTPLHLIMAFEGLRVLALGGIIKGFKGEFSLFFAKVIGVPDFLVGLTSLVAAYLIFRGVWKTRAAVVINSVGFLVIVPSAMILMNFGLPGPMHFVDETPSLTTIFDFPMVLAPTLVVPIFAIVNLFVVIRLIQRN